MRTPLPWVFVLALPLAGSGFAADPAGGVGARASASRDHADSPVPADAGPAHPVRRRLVRLFSPLFLETTTASRAASWLKELKLTPSPAAVVHVMNPYHIQRLLSDSQRSQIHAVGMAGFYADQELMATTLATLQAQYRIRSALMRAGGPYFSR